jgi:hypothetical protein
MTAKLMTLRDDRFAERHQSQLVITTSRVILRRKSSQRVVSSFEEGHPLADFFVNDLLF